ncbi:hypothetical protein G8S52_02555 [Clostridium botulinum C]|uniref:hypothetical protein n=1 Tax=Clostridium botulinum TaxID=1491 RepID=UPI001E3B59C7|nr:hypothetical protein [Clostridium botulinum]MCD3261154.1 hypothetical protein [Clostridium botulinum C]
MWKFYWISTVIAIGFWDGKSRGTANSIQLAKNKGIKDGEKLERKWVCQDMVLHESGNGSK